MNFYIFISIFFLFTLGANKNIWSYNTIIYKGDTLNTSTQLLEKREGADSLLSALLGTGKSRKTDYHLCDYHAEWTIENDQIYLTKMEILDGPEVVYTLDLPSTFKGECFDGKVYAYWITEGVFANTGKLIVLMSKYQPIFENETFFSFESGRLVETTFYDNSKSYCSVFHYNNDSLKTMIYGNINWSSIPDLKDKNYTVYVSLQSSDVVRPDSVIIEEGCEISIINDEALRVIQLLPEWDIYYYRGQFHKNKMIIPIVFSEERLLQYQQTKR
jgi:hypothetical protein